MIRCAVIFVYCTQIPLNYAPRIRFIFNRCRRFCPGTGHNRKPYKQRGNMAVLRLHNPYRYCYCCHYIHAFPEATPEIQRVV